MDCNDTIKISVPEKPFFSDVLAFDFEERKNLIDKHKKELKYICELVDHYIKDVTHILLYRMPTSMISNLTYNLVHNLVSCYVGLTVYDYLQTAYLIDEDYDANYELWKDFSQCASKIEKMISNLTDVNIYNIGEDSYCENLQPSEEYKKRVPLALLKLQHMLSKINGESLFVALLDNIRGIESRLETIKLGINNLTEEDFETIYNANYAHYVETYWPSEGKNFRHHIEEHYFFDRESKIDTLSKLLRDEKSDFERTNTGALWRDYFHDKKSLYFKMRNAKIDEEQWKFFFKKICRFEEYEKWIEELRNPQILQVGESNSKSSGIGSTNEVSEKIVGFFTDGILNVDIPSDLYFLLLAMWARRLLQNKEIPAFVRMVGDAHPSLFNAEHTQEEAITSLRNMNKKTKKYFDEFVKDQSTMIEYIDMMYPKTKKGGRRKECERAVNLANQLFLKLK